MATIKVLFATDFPRPRFSIFRGFAGDKENGSVSAVILSPSPSPEWKQALTEYHISSAGMIPAQPLVSSILAAARQENPSLILVDLDQDQEDSRTFSIIKGLLKKSTLPVMAIPPHEEPSEFWEQGIFHHVIFATDWSRTSENAYNFLLNFKCSIKELEIINVIKEKLTIRTLRELKQKLEEKRRVCCQEHCLDAEFHIYAGRTWEEILKAGDDYRATLLILGAIRKGGVKELFRKRTGWRVAKRSRVPVLIVPTGAG